MHEDVWYFCPNCNYAMSEVLVKAARFDYPCPRCGERNLSEFYPHRTTNEELREWLIDAEHDAWHDYKYSEDKTKRGNPFYEGYADAMADAIAKLEELGG